MNLNFVLPHFQVKTKHTGVSTWKNEVKNYEDINDNNEKNAELLLLDRSEGKLTSIPFFTIFFKLKITLKKPF